MKQFKTLVKLWLPLVLTLFFLAPHALAGGLPTATPEEVGMSSEKLAALKGISEKYIADNKIAGTVVLMVKDGKVFYYDAVGNADTGKPMQKDSIFRIASMSKAITTVATMILYEEGRLDLDDKLPKYIPEFAKPNVLVRNKGKDRKEKPYFIVPARREITIRDLLTHTSGVTYCFWGRRYLADLYLEAGISDGLTQTEGTIGEMMAKLGKLPLFFHPGEKWEYGLNNDVLGRVIEVASGMPFDKFLEKRIFKPLGMKDTFFFVPKDKVDRLTAIYSHTKAGPLRRLGDEPEKMGKYLVHSASYHYKGPRTYFSGGGGLASTAMDYALFLQMIVNGGELNGVRIINNKSITTMTTNQVGNLKAWGAKWGFGGLVPNGPTENWYVWGGHFYTSFWADMDKKMIGVVLCQLDRENTDHNKKIWNAVGAATLNKLSLIHI